MKLATAAAAVALAAALPSAQATVSIFATPLSGAAEAPPNDSMGTGTAMVSYDDVANTLRVQVTFAGLTGTTTAAHIHCCVTPISPTVGVATELPLFTGFPTGVSSGMYDHTFDALAAATYNPAFITAKGGTPATALAALIDGMTMGTAYLNVHSTYRPGGEIRGFLMPVPEPSTYALMLLGIAAVGAAARRRRA